MKLLAYRYDCQGSALRESGDSAGAIRLFQRAIQHAPRWSVPWYNLGLTYKYLRSWNDSYRCNAEAVRLNPSDEAAIWNLGIAATAVQDWTEARRAWTLFGISLPPGTGPIQMNLGSVPIRINPDTDAEVVWARRIDPARALLTSIPLADSNHRYGDLVLHDGAPAGYRLDEDVEVPVFNELDLLARGAAGTFEVRIHVRSIGDLTAFEQACATYGCATEDWSTIRVLCQGCSEGRPHPHPDPPIEGEHRFAVAASTAECVAGAVRAWKGTNPDRVAGEVAPLVAPLDAR